MKYTTPTLQRNGKQILLVWENYALATELNKKGEPIQVATVLTVIGEEAKEVSSTFNDWVADSDDKTGPIRVATLSDEMKKPPKTFVTTKVPLRHPNR